MIIVQVKEGELIERALKKFKRKFEKTGIVMELRSRQAFQKHSVTNRKNMMKAIYVLHLRANEDYSFAFYTAYGLCRKSAETFFYAGMSDGQKAKRH